MIKDLSIIKDKKLLDDIKEINKIRNDFAHLEGVDLSEKYRSDENKLRVLNLIYNTYKGIGVFR